jgi:hypothetical protein
MRRTIGYMMHVRHSLCVQILLPNSKDYRKSFPILQTITNPFRFYRLSQVLPDASRICKLYCKSLRDSEDYLLEILPDSINV